MPGEGYGSRRTEDYGHEDQDQDGRERVRLEAAVDSLAYEVWQENGRDSDLERVVEKLQEEHEKTRDIPDGDPRLSSHMTIIRDTVKYMRERGQ